MPMTATPEVPKYPSMFFRAPDSLVGHLQPLVRPRESEQLDYEGEIALVIGRAGRRIAPERGARCMSPASPCATKARSATGLRHGKFNVTQGKNWDASGSIGPWHRDQPTRSTWRKPLHLTVKINGEVTQDDTTDQHDQIVCRADRLCQHLHDAQARRYHRDRDAGQARPAHDQPRWLQAGDVIEIEVPEIGVLRNTVVAEL